MSKLYRITNLIVSAFLLFNLSLSAQTPDLPSEVEGVSPSWWSQVNEDLAQREYIVNYNVQDESYRAFNRKNGIISSLNSGKFSLKPTLDSGQTEYAWHTSLETASIEFDGVSIYQAKHTSTAAQNENTVEFNHKDFTEQYVNTQQGIRQNFILHQGPTADQIRIKIKVNGLSLNKRNDNEIALYEKNKGGIQARLLYKDIKSWDANGIALASKLEVEGEHIILVVNTTGAVYPITIDPISTTASTTVESNQISAYFGTSVSSAGDVNGDGYSDVIVGAYEYDNGQTDEGAAFIYHGSASGISTTASAFLESNQVSADFGISVSSAGDVNGDGYSDVIVGARLYDNGQSNEGRAYIYHGSASGISTTASTILEENQADASFGISVSSAGDVNGDGYSDVIVGAGFYDNGQTNEGLAFIYHGSASGVSTTASTTLEENQDSAVFGYSVSSAGDVNGDGYSDVIVGAYFYDNGQTDEGRAFVYHGSASGISTTASTFLESNQVSANFGISVSSAGDVNGDGYSDVIIGARYYDNGQNNEGRAFVYHGSASGISTTASTILEENQADALFGISVSSAGDVNGDGYSDVIVGALYYDNGQSNEGRAFIYHGASSGISSTASTTLESNQASAEFGISVSSAGDVNGDGYSDVIVGAWDYDNGQSNEGGAFVYHGNAGGANNYGVLKDYDDNLSSLYTSTSFSDANRGIGLTATSFLGRQKAKLAYETKGGGNSFSGSPVTNGVTNTGIQSTYTDLGISGVELTTTYVKDAFIRARVKYDPVTAITGQMYGPWRYLKIAEFIGGGAVPVDLIDFTALAAANTTAELTWATASEIDNSHFMIERSYDTRSFEAIARVEGNGTSSEVIDYGYTDNTIAKGTRVAYYRLHQFDYNGGSEYSDVRRVAFGTDNLYGESIAIYPNPFTSDVYIDFSTLSGGEATIAITNINGKQLIEQSIDNTEQIEKVDLSSLPEGLYFVKVTTATSTRIVKVIKK